ncbi:MAG: hypothetical protein IT374_09825 [Polyangiaceae bacterium]|nr:hypothetical protein [Polyangiaceae bacterium]
MLLVRKLLAVSLLAFTLVGASACCCSGQQNSAATVKCKQVGSVTCNSCCVSNRAKRGTYSSSSYCTCY